MNTMTNKLLEVKLLVEPSIIEETLTRMGIPDNKNKILYHVLGSINKQFFVQIQNSLITE